MSGDKGLEDLPEGMFLRSITKWQPLSVILIECSFNNTGQIESNYDEVTDSFDAMNLKSELLRGMYRIF